MTPILGVSFCAYHRG